MGVATAPTATRRLPVSRIRHLLSPLRNPALRRVFAAKATSGFGDWAGRLALAVLVYERSSSATWAAAVTIVSLLPWLGPGQLLATFADRFGRIRVMVGSDLARAALFAMMLLPLPIHVLLVLAFAAGTCSVAFAGARAATLFEVSDPDDYPAALSLNAMLHQAEILVGYALGGVIIAAVGATAALGVNAATFALSALLIATVSSSAASEQREDAALGVEGVRRGLRIWRDDPMCGRALLLFAGVAAFMVLPEALVVPAADEIGVPPALVGLLTAFIAIGAIIGIALAPSGGEHADLLRRTAVRGMIASVIAAGLFATGAVPAFLVLAFVVSGMADAVSIPTNQVVGERLPATGRAAAMAVAVGVANGTQVVSIAIAGLAADRFGTLVPLAVGMTAAAGVCLYAVVRPVADDRRVTGTTDTPAPTPAALAEAA